MAKGTAKQIRQFYLEESKTFPRKKDRLALYRKLIQLADEKGMAAYSLCFQGFLKWAEGDLQSADEMLKEAIKKEPKLALAWNGLGNVYFERKEHGEAIRCYNKAIELDGNFAPPWINLGNVYRDLTIYDEAVRCLNKAIELDGEAPSPWNVLGTVYRDRRNYDEAVHCYNMAIELGGNNTIVWNNLGIVYSIRKDLDEAIRCFEKAISLDAKDAHTNRNLGITYLELGEPGKAVDCFANAANYFRGEGNDFYAQNSESLRERARQEAFAKLKAKKEKERDPTAYVLAVSREAGLEGEAAERRRSFKEFLDEMAPGAGDALPARFEVLRRWNSYTPIIADDHRMSKGGGYFIKAEGDGIVIDPGFNFIDNFKAEGHTFREIDAILISHAHNDHTADLESILTLLHKYNEEVKGKKDDLIADKSIRWEVKKRREERPDSAMKGKDGKELSLDEEVEEIFRKSQRRKHIDIYLTQSTEKKFSGMLDLRSRAYYTLHTVEKGHTFNLFGRIPVRVLPAHHDDIISDRDAVGFLLRVGETALFYTGDTGWNEALGEEYRRAAEERKFKGRYRLLVAHLGGFKEYESQKDFYPNHLGRAGIAELCKVLKPDLCLISEFGEELRNCRERLAKIFYEAFKKEIIFIPADIGLSFDCVKKAVKTICAVDPENRKCTNGWTAPDKVDYFTLLRDYSLTYYESGCGIDVGKLAQVLMLRFDRES